MADGRVIRGIIFSNEEIQDLEKQGLAGDVLDLHLSWLHVSQIFSTAKGCYDAYLEIWKARHNTKENRAFPVHYFRHFFIAIEHSLWQNTILSLAHLVENDKRTLNINSFLDDLETKKDLARYPIRVIRVISECRTLLAEQETAQLIKEILIYRHNVVAHKNYKLPNAMSAFRIAPITIGSPNKLLELLGSVIEKLHRLFFGKEVDFKLSLSATSKETIEILDLLSVFIKQVKLE